MVTTNLKDLLISCGAIRFGDFTLASGKKSRVYVDIKKAVTDPYILKKISDETCSLSLSWDCVAGVAVGGVPLAVAVSLTSKKPYVVIRKEQKGYGLSNLVIGDVEGKKILLIEDVTTSGGSAIFGIEQIRKAGGIIDEVISVVDRGEGAETLLNAHEVRLISLVNMQELLND